MTAQPAPLPRKHVPCRRCGRGVLCAPYLGAYPTFIRCAACYQTGGTAALSPQYARLSLADTRRQAA